MTENRPFALGGGPPREVEILRGPTAKKDNIITKKKNVVDQLLLLVVFFEYDSIPEKYHMPAIAVIIIYCFRGMHEDFRGGNRTTTLYARLHCTLLGIDSKLYLRR